MSDDEFELECFVSMIGETSSVKYPSDHRRSVVPSFSRPRVF
jgi:hypothetical protein